MRKKHFFFLLVIMMALFCVSALAELSVPENIHWKEGSSATAAWEAVTDANYYRLKVSVYDGDTLLGIAETGTASTEIDVQQEIYQVVWDSDLDYVDVSFSVAAEIISIDGDRQSSFSAETEKCFYKLHSTIRLPIPSNVVLNEDYSVLFDPVEHVSWYYYQIKYSYDGKVKISGTEAIYTYQINQQNPISILNNIKDYYTSYGFTDEEVEISIRVQSFSYQKNNPEYLSSAYSDWAAPVTYKRDYEVAQLPIPTNIVLNPDHTVLFDPVEHVSWYYYQIKYSYNGKDKVSGTEAIYTYQVNQQNPVSILNNIKDYYTSYGFTDEEVEISIRVQSFSYQKNNPEYSSSDYSDWTTPVVYKRDYEITQLPIPTNIVLNADYTVLFDPVEHVSWYYYQIRYNYNGKDKTSGTEAIYTYQINQQTPISILNDIKDYYTSYGFTDEEVEISIRVQSFSYQKNNPEYSSSDYSDWTAPVLYSPTVKVQSILLSPTKPILYCGHSYYLGKTIVPENAHYEKINWSSSDDSIVTVNQVGRISGITVGEANVSAAIDSAVDSVTVTVYTIESNVESDTETQIVTDAAGTIIDDIGNNENPDISNTDILEGNVEEIHNQILEGIERGDVFYIDWWWTLYGRGHYSLLWDDLLNLLGGGQFACGYDAGFEMYHEESDGTHHTIGNITEFKQEIEFDFDLPDLPDVQPCYHREFSLARIHDGQTERIPVTIHNGKWSAKSDRFSDFVLLYNDSPVTDEQMVTVEYTFPSETAQIGQPFTVEYEIKGGSGQYEDIYYGMDEVTEHCCINDNYQGGALNSAKGSFTVVPESGESIDVNVSCKDKVTGIIWCENYSTKIPCMPNQSIPVTLAVGTDTIALNEEFSFSYLVGGDNEIESARAEVWSFARNDTYPDCVLTQTIDNKAGTITYIPRIGDQLYIAVRGKDKAGEPFYVKTERLLVDTQSGYEPVTVEYTFPSETVQIGQPFTVGYEIKGGSGQYEDIYYGMDEVTEHCCINDNYQGGALTSAKGSFTIVPESGESIDVNVSCKDSVTGIVWCENYSSKITCTSNQSIPATITVGSETISLKKEFSFNYSIGGSEEIESARAEVWVFARNDTYPDCVLDQNITSKVGTITYTPLAGNQLYIAIRGKDTSGAPFYVKTGRIEVSATDTPNWAFCLPTGITTIDDNAFEGISAEAVYIPSGCESIGKEAFKDSSISAIYIPSTVESIGDNAIPKDAIIYTPANSPASIWAAENGFEDHQVIYLDE